VEIQEKPVVIEENPVGKHEIPADTLPISYANGIVASFGSANSLRPSS